MKGVNRGGALSTTTRAVPYSWKVGQEGKGPSFRSLNPPRSEDPSSSKLGFFPQTSGIFLHLKVQEDGRRGEERALGSKKRCVGHCEGFHAHLRAWFPEPSSVL